MARAAPLVRSFNGGETSQLVEGRTDIDRYPSTNRKMLNGIAAPQGPWIPRSGTEFMNSIYQENAKGMLLPFVFSETDFTMVEFGHQRCRFFTEDGLLTYSPVAGTVTSASPFKIDSATLGANVGDQVALAGFPATYNLNGVVGNITAKVGTEYTIDIVYPALPLVTAQVARVYHIVSPYTTANLPQINDTPSLDVVYLWHPTVKTYKLKRMDTYDWSFEAVVWADGPYLPANEEKTTLSVSVTGKATPNMTADGTPSGTASGSSKLAGSEYYFAFDDPSLDTFWQSNTDQTGTINYAPATPFICDGYSIHMAINNADTNYTSKDYAPSNFTFEGYDGSTWHVLDKKNNYVLYDENKSAFFEIANTVAYQAYRLNIKSVTRNGAVKPCVKSLVMRSAASSVGITVTASATTGINNDQGFLATDVGRLIRMRGDDNAWRSLLITARTNSTTVTCTLLGEPFPNLNATDEWRLGAWSDTTGYAGCGVFFQDRLWAGGSTKAPDIFAFSVTGDYENMAPSTTAGEVLDTSGFCGRLNARRLSRIKWMEAGKDGLLMGTGSQEYLVKAGGTNNVGKTITPGNVTADPSSSRGSSDTSPVAIDLQVLFVQRSGRTVREFAYNYEVDGYKSPSMSSLASHLGVSPFTQMAYAAEPYSIVWMLRQDGKVVGLTYNRDESVIGWHRHDFAGGEVESIAVLPASDQLQDVLWMIVKRTIDGQTRRYVEKLTRFWDFGMVTTDAWYVDCGLRYIGDPIDEIYGLSHLEGRDDIYGVADGVIIGPLEVVDGMVALDAAASNIVIGIGFDAEGETARLENGAADGTAQGKEKRFNAFKVGVWSSYGGEIGTFNEDTREVEYTPLKDEYPGQDETEIETITLYDGIVGPITPAPGYDKNGSVFFRRPKDSPLPFNITSIMPILVTQDGA